MDSLIVAQAYRGNGEGSMSYYQVVNANLERDRTVYLSELLYSAADLVDSNVPGSKAFYYHEGVLGVRVSNGSFTKYSSPSGDGGILTAIPWDDFSMVLTREEQAEFLSRGVSLAKILGYSKDTVVFSKVLF